MARETKVNLSEFEDGIASIADNAEALLELINKVHGQIYADHEEELEDTDKEIMVNTEQLVTIKNLAFEISGFIQNDLGIYHYD